MHVPHGNVPAAERAAKLTADHGLAVAAYGSYHRANGDAPDPAAVLDSASALGAPLVRIWAGTVDADGATNDHIARTAERLNDLCVQARGRRIRVAAEWHGGTLTATAEGGRQLAELCPDLLFYWQPSNGRSRETRLDEFAVARPRLAHVHAFWWLEKPEGRDRRPLADGAEDWRIFLKEAADAPLPDGVRQRFAMLEFVRGDSPTQLRDDAVTLRQLLSEIS